MKQLLLLLTFTFFSLSAAVRPPTKAGTFDVLPTELRFEILKSITGDTLDEAMASVKRYYIAHPPSQKSIAITKAILAHLMDKFNLDFRGLQGVISKLQKLPSITVFQNKDMVAWIEQQRERLLNENKLREAAYQRNTQEIKKLIAQGVNVNARDQEGNTALDYALGQYDPSQRSLELKNLTEIVSDLLNAGANANSGGKGTPLIGASIFGSPTIVKMLLKSGANPNITNSFKDTPLIMTGYALDQLDPEQGADKEDYKEIIRMLLEARANPNARSQARGRLTVREFIERAAQLTDEEKTQLMELLRKHGLKE